MQAFQILQRLKEPFPEKKSFQQNMVNAAVVGLFIAIFLYLFRPFGFNAIVKDTLQISCIFGLITFLITVLFDATTRYLLKFDRDTDKWTLGRWILDTLILVFFIAIGNYLYLKYLASTSFSWKDVGSMLISTYILGLFPIVISGMLIQIKAAKRNQSEAQNIQNNIVPSLQSTKEEMLNLFGQNEGQKLTIAPSDFLFAESHSNYVSIHFHDSGKVKSIKLRNTIQVIEAAIESHPIFRCHRSFLVNLSKVKTVKGNAQGLRIELMGFDQHTVPVSRRFVKPIRKFLSTSNA